MTPATMWTRLAATLAVVAAAVSVLPPEPLIVTARLIGLVVAARLIVWYHRNADWASTRIGRGTMAIKAGIFSIALGANIRTLNTHVDHDLDALAHRAIAAAWLLLAVALIFRLVTMRRIQAAGDSVVVAEKEHP